MSDLMTFPYSVEEFMEQYKIIDTDGIYMSKGAELVPIFRMKQWFEHLPSAQAERKVGKWEVHNILDYAQRPTGRKILRCPFCGYLTDDFRSRVDYYHKLTHFCPNCGAEMTGGEKNG